MIGVVIAVAFTVFLWWFSTGAILYLNRLPRRTFRWTMCASSIVLLLSFHGLALSSAHATTVDVYLAFTYALLVWAWHEIAFLTGFITGPRTDPCPPERTGWRRTAHAIATILYHELAIAVTAGLIFALTWSGPNKVGLATFLILWIMRLSAKLNLFLGVPNLMEDFLPDNLAYLKSVFTRKPMNMLFPVSITASTIVAFLLVQHAAEPGATNADVAGFTLLATLMVLAIVEHWFLVLPLNVSRMWSWGLRESVGRRPFMPSAKDGGRFPTTRAT